jgi:hypothetical protein
VTDTDQRGTPQTDVKDAAKEQAQNVAATTKDEAASVVETAKEQVQAVASDLRGQTRQLTDEARTQLTDHAFAQRDNAVENLRSIGDELTGMAEKADSPGMGAQLIREVGGVALKSADFLQEREPGQLVEELRGLARRRPGAFLIGAAVAGLVVGRVARGAKSAHSTDSTDSSSSSPTGGADSGYVAPTAEPVVVADAWGPTSPTYPESIPSDVEPGVIR